MTRKLTTRTSTAGSPSPSFKHQGNLVEKIIEEQGKKFRIETIGGREFRLPLDTKGKSGNISWSSMSTDERVAYAVAYFLENDCGISGLPGRLRIVLNSNPEEMRQVLEGLGRKAEEIQVLNGQTFTLPLNREGNVSWSFMTSTQRIEYAIAYCKHHNCGIKGLPANLYHVIRRSGNEKQGVLEGIGRKSERTEVLNGITFKLPLDSRGNISWQSMTNEERISYAIAFCLENKCGTKQLPRGLEVILRQNTKEKQRILDGIGKKSEEVQVLNGQTFTLPLNNAGKVSWSHMPPELRVSYAIAFCLEHKCIPHELPHGLLLNLTPKQKDQIRRELSKLIESDQLEGLFDAMVKF